MKRIAIFAVLICLSVLKQFGVAQDQFPNLLRHFQFIPRLSTLTQTGGFAGVHTEHRVRGTYDFLTSPGIWDGSAKFLNVDAWASVISPFPTPAYVLSLDQVFNLSGLTGEQLPVAAPFDVYSFRGTTDDGSRVRLLAANLGRWMYLRGETMAPEGSSDFFEYQLQALARQRPVADFNLDGFIDHLDLPHWKSGFGGTSLGAGDAESGDADGDGDVDGADFLAWQRQVGETAPNLLGVDLFLSAALAGQVAVTAVPEPMTNLLVALVLGAMSLVRIVVRS